MSKSNTRFPEHLLSFMENGEIFDLIPAKVFPGDDTSPVMLVYGPNATGKSFLLKILNSIAKGKGASSFPVSMSMRTSQGMHRCFMYSPYGDVEESTGLNSLIAVEGALRTLKSAKDKPILIILDEPDIGLSDGYAEAMGEYLAQELQDLPAAAAGLILCTHSKPLVRRFLERSADRPHAVHLYADATAQPLAPHEWIYARETCSVDQLLNMRARAKDQRIAINAWLEA